ncbi:STAG-domain-containing protein [Aaosphaeria arxii CBS 175.79]|uniref:STAG-domain-containing protein n=1 Tax=Aaosphaeria arxii CBS 175.79 TaxID=1450172 RepID=A0A6A5XEY5_9PLEO|nr:STAG-domain-containing protein [Aaosphaeria arxii CBS 175.79]KAF2011377.1 STAG-domain-containing protein [Aaosphaeria arxii CBS 175.79]
MSATPEAPRRRSGRVPKRKHVDLADVGSSADDSSDAEPDEEELREKRRKKAKKPKTNGATVSLAIRPAGPKAKKAPKPRKVPIRKSALHEEDISGLYAEVFAHGNKLEDVAAQWVASFGEHEARAVADVVNFVLRAAGCTIKIDENDIADPDNCPNRLGDIQEEYQAQEIVDYPLLNKTRGGTAFKHALQGFFSALIETIAQNGLLYNNTELIENIEVWISTMSSAPNRPFRHTSTVASLAITGALARVASEIVETTAKKIRQSEGESKKARVNKARVQAANKEVEELNQKLEVVDAAITDWFDTVYIHRYRDVDPRVRVECVEALADWIMTYPDKFFDGQHLRYLGWVLSDPHAPTRIEVLKQLQKLFSDSEKLGGLKTFTERFRPRIVEMATHDVETNVRTAAVELLDILREAGSLEPDDVDSVGRLVFDAEPKVRKAVVGFFAETINGAYQMQVEDMGGQEALDDALAPPEGEEEFENPRLEWLKLKCLVEQLLAYDSEDNELPSQIARIAPPGSELGLAAGDSTSRFYLATQAVYDAIPELQSWEVLAGYLLYDHSKTAQDGAGDDVELMLQQNCKLDEQQETTLLDVLNASVKITLQRLAESQKDKKKTKAQREADQEEHSDTVRKLSTLIPQLLKKFGAVPEAASLCLRLERELNLDVFQELRQTAALKALLDDVIRQFVTHHNEHVLDEAIQSISHHLTHEESQEITESKVQGLWDELLQTFNVIRSGQDVAARGDLPSNALTGLSNIVLKIAKLSKISEPSILDHTPTTNPKSRAKSSRKAPSTPPITTLLQILHRGIPVEDVDADTDVAEDALVGHTMNAMLAYFVWKFRYCANHLEAGTAIPDNELTYIAERRDVCLTALMGIMESRKGADDLRLEAAQLLLDIYNMFYALKRVKTSAQTPKKPQGRSTTQPNDDWEVLCQQIDAPTTKVLLQILTAAESNLAKRTRRHLEEPDIDDDPIDPDDEPESSDDEAEEEDERVQEEKKMRTLLAEFRLCYLGSRLVNSVQVGTLGPDVRKRLEKNKTKLGHDWKEVVAHLDIVKTLKSKAAKKGAKAKEGEAAPNAVTTNANAKQHKSKEIVVESDSEEEEEDEEAEEQGHDDDEEMADQDDDGDGDGQHVNGAANNASDHSPDVESVLGD